MARVGARIALQSGATALAALVVSAAGVFVGAGGVLLFLLPIGAMRLVAVLPLAIGGGLVSWSLASARRRRASDLVVDADGITIEGGPKHALSYGWPELTGARVEADDREYDKIGSVREYRHDLVLCARDGTEERVAESVNAAERASLQAIARGIRAACDRRTEGDREKPGARPAARTAARSGTHADLVLCPQCGAAVAPADAEAVACHYCGTATPMPSSIRARIAEASRAAASDADAERRLDELTAQPGALRANVLVALVAATALTSPAWIAGLGGAGLAVSIGVIGAAWGAAERTIADRIALRRLIVGLSPSAPAAEGHPYGCRSCGAPLPAPAAHRVIVACVHCGVRNLLAFGAFGASAPRAEDEAPAGATQKDGDELDDALAARTASRTSAIVMIGVSVAFVVGGVVYACATR